jgi:hypothetical protein
MLRGQRGDRMHGERCCQGHTRPSMLCGQRGDVSVVSVVVRPSMFGRM